MLQIRSPLEGGLGGASNHTNLRVHFAHRHVRDTIVILAEGNQPYSRCLKCDMFVSHKALNGQHLTVAFCRRGEELKRCHMAEEEAQGDTETAITSYRIPLAPVTSFKYLGRVLLASEND